MALEILCEVHTQTQTQTKPQTKWTHLPYSRKDDGAHLLCTYALMENTIHMLLSINRL